MIEALILGKLIRPAERRTANASGREFVTAKVRAEVAETGPLQVDVVAFSTSAGDALLALSPGDSVALSGTLKVGIWTNREGEPRPQLGIVAGQVLTLYSLRRKRRALAGAAAEQDGASP